MKYLLILVVLALGACSESSEENKDPIGEPYHDALDKAAEVEAIVEEQAEATRQEIEEAEGN